MTTPVTGVPVSEGQAAAAERASTTATARSIASKIVQQMQATEPVTPQTPAQPTLPKPDVIIGQEGTQADAQRFTTEPVAATVAATDTAPATEEVVEEVSGPDLDEIDRIVQEAALDLGVHPRDVPTELLPVFEKLVQNAVQIRASAEAERLQAAEQIEQVQEFARQLKESPDRLLLTLAVSNPEVFTQAIETFQEMQANPKMKDMVIRELTSEARLREAERKERVLNDSTYRDRAQRVITATQVSSRKHGVPFEVAEQIVASAITQNQGKLEPGDVEAIVAKLATDLRAKNLIRKQAPRVATPAKVAAAAAAPNTEVGAAKAPPAAQPSTASAGLTETTPHGRLRSIISRAVGAMRPDQQ